MAEWRTRRSPIFKYIAIVLLLGAAGFVIWKVAIPAYVEYRDNWITSEVATKFIKSSAPYYRHIGVGDPTRESSKYTMKGTTKWAELRFKVKGDKGTGVATLHLENTGGEEWVPRSGSLTVDGQSTAHSFFDD